MRNIYIAIGFGIITISQLTLGIYMISLAGKEGGKSRLLHHEWTSFSVPV